MEGYESDSHPWSRPRAWTDIGLALSRSLLTRKETENAARCSESKLLRRDSSASSIDGETISSGRPRERVQDVVVDKEKADASERHRPVHGMITPHTRYVPASSIRDVLFLPKPGVDGPCT